MNFFEQFCERVVEGGMKLLDIPILAVMILAAVVVVGGEVGCVLWFFGILISAMCEGAAKLMMLILCAIIFSILSAIICFVAVKLDM